MIREEMFKNEGKITKEIKENKRSRKIWEDIDKLKGEAAKDSKENGEGKQLSGEETCISIEQRWDKIYKKHEK